MLYDKVYREDILAHAYARARPNRARRAWDEQSFEEIESAGLAEWIDWYPRGVTQQDVSTTAGAAVMIPKPRRRREAARNSDHSDRVVQTAAKLLIEPIFEGGHGTQVPMGTDRSGARRTQSRKCMSCFVKAITDVV